MNAMMSRIWRPLVIVALALTCLASSDLAHSEVTIYFEDFENGEAGWVSVNHTVQTGVYWQHAMYDGLGVAWCGTDDPSFATPPGYGNSWVQDLWKPFAIPEGDPGLTFRAQLDTEGGHDFLRAQISTDGGLTFGDHSHVASGSTAAAPGGFLTYVTRLNDFGVFRESCG